METLNKEITEVVVEWFRENRRVSSFMVNAGLGLNGVGVTERTIIEYKPGEVVDEARVLEAVNKMIACADSQNLEFKISRPHVVEIRKKKQR